MIRATSIEAYNEIKRKGLLSEKRFKVYEIFINSGDLTGSQVALIYKTKYPAKSQSETIRNRITELVQMKVLEEKGITECPVTGRKVLLFGVTDSLPTKLPVKKTRKQKKEELKLEIQERIDSMSSDLFNSEQIS
jgi:hypothetical protein